VVGGEVYNPYQYTGEAWDAEVELLYLRARYYQPEVGRFITKDPWAGDVWRSLTLNRYVYVTSNPVNLVDPRGNEDSQPTPTPTGPGNDYRWDCDVECQIQQWLQQRMRAPSPDVPERDTYFSAFGDRGVSLLLQRTVASRQPDIVFGDVYVEREHQQVVLNLGSVRSNLDITVKVYANGTYLQILDTFNTSQLMGRAMFSVFEPLLYRSVEVASTQGSKRGPWPVMNVECQALGLFWIGPLHMPDRRIPPGRFDPIPYGFKGRGEVWGGVWLPHTEGLPSKVRMTLTLSELQGSAFSWQMPPRLGFGAASSYEVSLEHIYPKCRL
jgi:RHS repeat-associated protein